MNCCRCKKLWPKTLFYACRRRQLLRLPLSLSLYCVSLAQEKNEKRSNYYVLSLYRSKPYRDSTLLLCSKVPYCSVTTLHAYTATAPCNYDKHTHTAHTQQLLLPSLALTDTYTARHKTKHKVRHAAVHDNCTKKQKRKKEKEHVDTRKPQVRRGLLNHIMPPGAACTALDATRLLVDC